MEKAEKKLNIYRVIIPEKDFKNLTEPDQDKLADIMRTIDANRVDVGKKMLSNNKYIVCNQDEPYSEKVWQEILKGETDKIDNELECRRCGSKVWRVIRKENHTINYIKCAGCGSESKIINVI